MATRRKRYKWLDSQHLPIGVYLVFTLGGMVHIVVTKTFEFPAALTIAVPILLMAIYMAVSIILGKLRLHDEQIGDNLYYMGFLYTLTSLGVSLYNFGTGAAGDAEDIVRNFGVAVTSTIAGIMLRIMYNQMRRDPIDIERAARHELAEATRKIRTELEGVSREFADFRRVSNQMLEEGFGEIANQAQRNGDNIRTSLEKLADEAIRPVRDASTKLGSAMEENVTRIENQFSEIAKKVDSAAELLEKANAAMSASVWKLGQQADNVAVKLEKVVVPDEVLKNELAPMVKTLSAAVAQYAVKTEAASREQQERMTALAESLAKAAAASEKAAEAVVIQQKSSETIVRLVEKQGQETNQLFSRLLEAFEQRKPAAPTGSVPTVADRAAPPVSLPPDTFQPISPASGEPASSSWKWWPR